MKESRGGLRGHWTLYWVFFFSGISGLIYESLWSRYIKQFMGSAATAQILVLSLFMGGMSLGALLAGRFVARLKSPVFAYGVVEGAIGLYALLFPSLHAGALRLSYDVIFPALGAGTTIELARWAISALLVLPPCVLLGTTFPLMSVGILRRSPERSGEILSFLYFTNSFGAAVGALVSGFLLIDWLGLQGTLAVAAAINLAIMVAAALLGRRPSGAPLPGAADSSRPGACPLTHVFAALAFGTGLSSFMYEIGWIRLLSMMIGSATHSFEVMLSAFILGLALGGLWVKRRMDRFQRPELVLAFVQIVMGVVAAATLPLYPLVADVLSLVLDFENPTKSSWYAFNIVRYLLCLMIMLPATFCAGMTLPLLTHLLLRRGAPEGIVGRVYGQNTLGAICGATLAGLVLLPAVGLKWTLALGALVDVALGAWLVLAASPDALRRFQGKSKEMRAFWGPSAPAHVLRLAVLVGLVILSGGFFFTLDPAVLTASTFRGGRARLPLQHDVLAMVDGRTATVAIVETNRAYQERVIFTNGKPDASVVRLRNPFGLSPRGPRFSSDEPTQVLLGVFPLAVRPDAVQAAMIGFGSGMSVHALLGSPRLRGLDTIEIEPEMVNKSRYFYPANARAYDDARSHIHYDDAKAFFASARKTYDIIVSEPSNPWVSGVASLFSSEFYREAKRYLGEGGIFAQWIHGYELGDDSVLSILAAVQAEFSDYQILQIGYFDWVILATPEGRVPELSAEIFEWPQVRDSLDLLGIERLEHLESLRVAGRVLLEPHVRHGTANRDSHPILDTRAEYQRFTRARSDLLMTLRRSPVPFLETFRGKSSRSYPMRERGRLHDPNLLAPAVQARLLMAAYQGSPVRELPQRVDLAAMERWKEARKALGLAPSLEKTDAQALTRFWTSTVEVFVECEPYFRIHEQPFWAEVRSLVAAITQPDSRIRREQELLDALSRRDAGAAGALSVPLLGDTVGATNQDLVEQIRAWTLLPNGAAIAEREEFLAQHLQVDEDTPAERKAFVQALRHIIEESVVTAETNVERAE